MTAEFREREHVLRLATVDGERDLEVWHRESCTQFEPYEGVSDYDCGLGNHVREWGLDLHLSDVPDGIYLAEYWATPPSWAGAVPIEPNDGIDLQALMVDPSWDGTP